jgi:hypothetical protein
MTEQLEYIESLARRAQFECAPQGDVSRRVLLRLPSRSRASSAPLFVFATGYAAVASMALAYGYVLLGNMSDPLLSLFQQAAVVTP